MIVQHIIEDLEKLFEMNERYRSCEVFIAEELGDGEIYVHGVEAVHWDDDEEFFFVPDGYGKHYDLKGETLLAGDLLLLLKAENIDQYEVLARSKVVITKEGSIVSVNVPLQGTGYKSDEPCVYFFYGADEEQ